MVRYTVASTELNPVDALLELNKRVPTRTSHMRRRRQSAKDWIVKCLLGKKSEIKIQSAELANRHNMCVDEFGMNVGLDNEPKA